MGPFFVWMYNISAVGLPEIPSVVADGMSNNGLQLTGTVSVGQIAIIITMVWMVAKVFFPLLARVKALEGAISDKHQILTTMQTVQIKQGENIQRILGRIEARDRRGGDLRGGGFELDG